jgi:putative ABC transport system ATP-binding protein
MLCKAIDIYKKYSLGKVEVEALRGVSLEIEKGEYISIMGPSGSGKSTLMHILGCLDTPTKGEYDLEEKRVSDYSDMELARIRNQFIGFIFQNFNLLTRLSALDNVALPLIYAGVNKKERTERAKEILTRVGLKERTNHRPNELSGGECQRVAVARALINNPKIIFADEPTGNLDTKTGKEIMELFDELHREGNTIVLVTHDTNIAVYAKRIIKLMDGRIVSG